MVHDFGMGTLMAENEEEAIWWHQAENAKDYVKQLEGSIRKSESDLKLSQREVHQKFLKGCKANIKEKKLALIVQKEFLKLCQSKIKPTQKSLEPSEATKK